MFSTRVQYLNNVHDLCLVALVLRSTYVLHLFHGVANMLSANCLLRHDLQATRGIRASRIETVMLLEVIAAAGMYVWTTVAITATKMNAAWAMPVCAYFFLMRDGVHVVFASLWAHNIVYELH